MSGFEAVGLALAIIPILTEVVSHYKLILEPFRLAIDSDHRKCKLADFLWDLDFEVVMLKETLDFVLNTSSGQKESRTRSDSIVGEGKLEEHRVALQDRLGEVEEQFLKLLEDTLHMLERVTKSTGLFARNSTEEPSSFLARLNRLRSEVKNGDKSSDNKPSLTRMIKFSTSEEKRQKCLKRVKQNNKKLERLAGARTARTLVAEDRSPTVGATTGKRIRELMKSLYGAISQQWNCTYHRHRALLSLSACCGWSERSDQHRHKVDLLLSTHFSPTSHWQESEISISHGLGRTSPGEISANAVNHPIPAFNVVTRSRMGPICETIEGSRKERTRLSIEYDGRELWHVTPASPTKVVHGKTYVTLGDLFGQSGRVCLKEKRVLAVILARSLLHLGESPWLAHQWEKEHILFLRDQTNEFDMSRAYITTQFQGQGIQPPYSDETPKNNYHVNVSVLALGILLLELEHWNGIETFSIEDSFKHGANSNLLVAFAAFLKVRDNLHQGYANAIDACLKCPFAKNGESSMNDESFREGFCDMVVQPLEAELLHGWDIKLEG